ncbi:MAG: hypothetical protein Unbinned664contig1000_26 [Prokaryotic dsDNA virus sp.]|nr:MAG: hypothetical protein Unbinned664contig1000_26 [Prokaryotic dsDNA virus sp.]|tara:strand:- start:20099 stop:20251 length:153 start_codon:yes stop_codon:yes gene_type:complete
MSGKLMAAFIGGAIGTFGMVAIGVGTPQEAFFAWVSFCGGAFVMRPRDTE